MKALHTNRTLLTRIYNLATGKTIGLGAETKDVPIPPISPHQLLVKVQFVALNAIDHKYIDLLSPRNSRLGCDYAGQVTQVGTSAASTWKVGDRIAGFVHGGVFQDQGAFAEFLSVDADLAWRVPEKMSDEDASTYGISAATAMLALNVHLDVPWVDDDAFTTMTEHAGKDDNDKKTILIYSGSTAIGLFAIQLAKAAGYRVITTASPKSQDLVLRYGADFVFDYRSPTAIQEIKTQFPNITKSLDCISAGPSSHFCAEVMRGNDGKVILLLDNGKSKVPGVSHDNIVVFTTFGVAFKWLPPVGPSFQASIEDRKALKRLYNVLPAVLEKIKAPPVEVLGKSGFEGIFDGLDLIRGGKVAGKKLVVKM